MSNKRKADSQITKDSVNAEEKQSPETVNEENGFKKCPDEVLKSRKYFFVCVCVCVCFSV